MNLVHIEPGRAYQGAMNWVAAQAAWLAVSSYSVTTRLSDLGASVVVLGDEIPIKVLLRNIYPGAEPDPAYGGDDMAAFRLERLGFTVHFVYQRKGEGT